MVRVSRVLAWSCAFGLLAATAVAAWTKQSGLRLEPGSQAALDAAKGSSPFDVDAAELPLLSRMNGDYWRARSSQPDIVGRCGDSVREAVLVRVDHTFRSLTDATILDGRRIVSTLPDTPRSAYLPGRDGRSAVLNPEVEKVQVERRESDVTMIDRWRLWWLIEHSRLRSLPISTPEVNKLIDGSSVSVVVCHDGLHYGFERVLSGSQPESEIQKLIGIALRQP